MQSTATDLDELLAQQSDVLSLDQALRYFTRSAVRHRLRSGRWERPRPGVYVTRPREGSVDQQRWIAVLGAPHGAITAGRTALAQGGLRGFDLPTIHLLLPHSARPGRPPSGVAHHRTRFLPFSHVRQLGRPPYAAPARAVLDAAQWAASDNEARTLIAASVQQRIVSDHDLRRVLSELLTVRRRRLITVTINDAQAGAHSLPELEWLALCRRGGLPVPTLQHRRRDADGRQRILDALFDDYGIHVEIDGAHHMDVQIWWADMRRQNDLWIAGERVLRFPSWAIRNEPDEVLRTVTAALRSAGWPG